MNSTCGSHTHKVCENLHIWRRQTQPEEEEEEEERSKWLVKTRVIALLDSSIFPVPSWEVEITSNNSLHPN